MSFEVPQYQNSFATFQPAQSYCTNKSKHMNHTHNRKRKIMDTTFNQNGTIFIRSPNQHDVLSGRGGAVNSHPGNKQFRDWVATRKNDYNLAQTKQQKIDVCNEIIELVTQQDPPGRFLQKAKGSEAWTEINEERLMAKVSQALREGAPQIKAQARKNEATHRPYRHKRKNSYIENSNNTAARAAIDELRANAERAQKRVRVNYNGTYVRPDEATPEMAPQPPKLHDGALEHFSLTGYHKEESPTPPPLPPGDSLARGNSLYLSGMSEDLNAEFVNPFENEDTTTLFNHFNGDYESFHTPMPDSIRSTSTGSSKSASTFIEDLEETIVKRNNETEFSQGLAAIYDALHPNGEGIFYPFSKFKLSRSASRVSMGSFIDSSIG